MFSFVKAVANQIILISHHIGAALSGAFMFGFVAYLLDIGGFRTVAQVTDTITGETIFAVICVAGAFVGLNMLMKRFMGKFGVF